MKHTKIRRRQFKQLFGYAGMMGVFALSSNAVSAQQVEKSAPAGTGIYEAALNTQDGHIYVTAAGSRTNPGGALYKLDPVTLATVDSIILKDNPPFGIGINSKTQIAYTTNTRTNTVSAVDLKTGQLIASFNDGSEKSHTREVLVDEDNNIIYVTNVGAPSDIWVIDGQTNKVIHTIPNVGSRATGLTFANGKDKIYITVLADNTVAVVNTKTKQVEKTFPSGGEGPINISSDGKRLFVTNQQSGTVTVLDTEGNLIKSVATGAGAIGIAYDPVKNRIYVANRGTGTTTVIDGTTYAVLADLETGSAPNHVRVDKDGVAYVVNKTKMQRRQGQGGQQPAGERTQQAPPVADTNGDTLTKIK